MTTEMSYDPIPIELVHEAAERIRDTVVRTPLVKLNGTDEIAEIHLKEPPLDLSTKFDPEKWDYYRITA